MPRLLVVCLGALGLACIEPFQGSHIEFALGGAVHVPGDQGDGFGRPPSNTHYEMWVVHDGYAYELKEFQIVPVIDREHPCFVEDDESPFPGLHSSKYLDKWIEVENPQPGDEVTNIADATQRMANMRLLEERLKAIVGHDPTVQADTVEELEQEMAAAGLGPEAIDDESNRRRKAKCEEFFANHPLHYVGNDRVFTLPHNGVFYGMVDGADPRNQAFVGGAGFDVDATFHEFDTLMINWQFNDPNDPRVMDFGPSPTGYHYMSGAPEYRTRRVVHVSMRNQVFSGINGNAAIYPGLDDDHVNF